MTASKPNFWFLSRDVKINSMSNHDLLAKELATYKAHEQELLNSGENKYVLIKGDKIIDTFVAEQDAINQGFEKFGRDVFLVKKITSIKESLNFTSFNVGI